MTKPGESLLIKGAAVFTADERRSFHPKADILIERGKISRIAPDLDAHTIEPLQLLMAEGLLAIPGLINAHLHSPGNLMRGTLDGLPLEIFMLYEVPPLARQRDSARLAYLRTAIGAIEMLKLGVTSVMDDAFFVPLTSSEAIDGILSAYRDAGMRATVALDQPIVVEYSKYPFLAEILPPAIKAEMDRAPRETEQGMHEHYRHLIETWHGAAGGRLTTAVSCSAPQRATVSYLEYLSELAKTKNLPFICHILETRAQRVFGDEVLGRSLVRYADELGILDEHMQAIHAIWVDDRDIEILAESGCTIAHNPVCNLRLGSGVMPFRKLRNAGVAICLGTDEAIADDSHNLWNAAKTGALIYTLADPDDRQWPTAREMLDVLWRGGARALRRRETLGALQEGAAADIALLDFNADAFTPLNDLERQFVFCETGSSVRHTIVDGRVVVAEGRLTTINEEEIKAEIRDLMPSFKEDVAALRVGAAQIEPYYREMLKRAGARDVGMRRTLA